MIITKIHRKDFYKIANLTAYLPCLKLSKGNESPPERIKSVI